MKKQTTLHRFLARCFGLALLVHAVLAVVPEAEAQTLAPPGKISYQGFLTDNNNTPLGNTTPTNRIVVFRIWSESTGGTNAWSEQQTVTIDRGYFSVLLGEGSQYQSEPWANNLTGVFTGPNGNSRFIEVMLKGVSGGSDLTIAPRVQLLPTAYSYLAHSAKQLLTDTGVPMVTTGAGGITVGGSVNATAISVNGASFTNIDAANITSGTVTDARLSANVAKLNSAQTFSALNTFSAGLRVGGSIQSTAGNPRGQDAVDLQTVRTASDQVASGAGSVIAGGRNNKSSAADSVVGGGNANVNDAAGGTIAGGINNTNLAAGPETTIGGGRGNRTTAAGAVIAGGHENSAGLGSVVGGGWKNKATGQRSVIAGGLDNETGLGSVVGGGYTNKATGQYSTVPGGSNNVASANFSFAAGRRAQATIRGHLSGRIRRMPILVPKRPIPLSFGLRVGWVLELRRHGHR